MAWTNPICMGGKLVFALSATATSQVHTTPAHPRHCSSSNHACVDLWRCARKLSNEEGVSILSGVCLLSRFGFKLEWSRFSCCHVVVSRNLPNWNPSLIHMQNIDLNKSHCSDWSKTFKMSTVMYFDPRFKKNCRRTQSHGTAEQLGVGQRLSPLKPRVLVQYMFDMNLPIFGVPNFELLALGYQKMVPNCNWVSVLIMRGTKSLGDVYY